MSTLKIEHISHLDNGTPDLSIDSSGHLNIVNGNLQMGGVTMLNTSTGAPLPLSGGTMTGRPVLNYQNPEIRFEDSDTNNNGEITLDNTSFRFESDPDNLVANSTIKFMVDGDTKATIDSNGLAVSDNLVATQKKALAHSLVFGG